MAGSTSPHRQAPADRVVRFRAGVEAAAGRFMEVGGWAELVDLARGLSDEPPVVGADLAEWLRERSVATDGLRVPSAERPLEWADAGVGLVRGELGVAETGSVLLLEPRLEERVVSMLCQTLVQGIERERIVDSLDDFAHWMREHAAAAPYATLTTGPSRTADIERSLTIGVQGARELVVAVVG